MIFERIVAYSELIKDSTLQSTVMEHNQSENNEVSVSQILPGVRLDSGTASPTLNYAIVDVHEDQPHSGEERWNDKAHSNV